jgi:trehalose utilization protein
MGKDGKTELMVRSVRLDDPEQGLPSDVLDNCDVLVWWGHQRHGEVKTELVKNIVQRIKSGQLSLISLHSAHGSKLFIEAMAERYRDDLMKSLSKAERDKAQFKYVQPRFGLYPKSEITPVWTKNAQPDGSLTVEVKLPSCMFSDVKDLGTTSHVTTLAKNHPITKGVPEKWDIPKDEIYDGPFHVPAPDQQIFHERWDTGAEFPGGGVWNLGKGKIFYFRPGHETYPVFKQPEVVQVMENAVRWLGKK